MSFVHLVGLVAFRVSLSSVFYDDGLPLAVVCCGGICLIGVSLPSTVVAPGAVEELVDDVPFAVMALEVTGGSVVGLFSFVLAIGVVGAFVVVAFS